MEERKEHRCKAYACRICIHYDGQEENLNKLYCWLDDKHFWKAEKPYKDSDIFKSSEIKKSKRND